MNFLILAAGRSGSTMLVNCLSSHPNVLCHHEPFNNNGWHKQIRNCPSALDALNHLDNNGLSIPLTSKLVSLVQKELGFHRGRIIIDPFKNRNTISSEGFKITWAQSNTMFDSMKKWISQKENMKLIFLYRHDVLARFVSYQLANMSGIWNSNRKNYSYKPFKISTISFKQFCDSEIKLESKMLEMISSSNTDVSFMAYEDLVSDPLKTTNMGLNFLGCNNISHLNIVTTKVIATPIRELIINFDELKSDVVNNSAQESRDRWKQRIENR